MASIAPRQIEWRLFLEPLRGRALVGTALIVWLAGAAYCHGYERLLSGPHEWGGSLSWSAIAVLPWFGLFEWSKQPQNAPAIRRPIALGAMVAGIAALSILLEYLINHSAGAVTDRIGLLVLRRMPAIGATLLLIALTRKAVLRRAASPANVELGALANAVDWVEAADNYIEVHSAGKVSLRRMTMRDAASALERHGFVRIHRRYLVNKSRIIAVDEHSVRLKSGRELPVGTAFATNLRHLA